MMLVMIYGDLISMHHTPRQFHQNRRGNQQHCNQTDNNRPPSTRKHGNSLRATIPPTEMCRVCHLVESIENRTAFGIQTHCVTKISVLPHVGIKFRQSTLVAQPPLVLEYSKKRCICLVKNKQSRHTKRHHPKNTNTDNHQLYQTGKNHCRRSHSLSSHAVI